MNGADRLYLGQLAYRNPSSSYLEVCSSHYDKGGVHPPYTRHMEDTTASQFVSAVAVSVAAIENSGGKPPMTGLTTVYDCTGTNLGNFNVPQGALLAAYVTGSAGVPWSPAQLAAHPDAIRIDQSPVNTPADETADVIDVEDRAATLSILGQWVTNATHNYLAGARPGQRSPVVYTLRSNVTPVVNTLIAAGITKGVGLWVAEEATVEEATAELNQAGGPFPIVGRQYMFSPLSDVSLFSNQWLNNRSGARPVSPPGPGIQSGWRFCPKCQSLFYGPGEAQSVCPRGGQHDGSHSHDYTLGFVD